jgi:hypothetical protein
VIAWGPDLVTDIARRRCVIFLGAGVSRNSVGAGGQSPKLWDEFLRGCAAAISSSRHIVKLIDHGDLLTACEVVKTRLGRDDFVAKLREEYLTPRYKTAPIHEHIFRLDSRIVATPNFDKIYETYANSAAGGSVVVKHHYDPDLIDDIRNDGRVILKIHGSIDSPDRMVFTRSEYARARQQYREFYGVLDALAMTHTFLFLGCGVNDPDMRLLLEDVFFRHPAARRHVMTLPSRALHADVLKVVEETMNLRILDYSPASTHRELTESIEQLATLVEARRDDLRISLNW